MKRHPAFLIQIYFFAAAFVYWQIDVLRPSTDAVSLADLDLYDLYYPLLSYGIESLKHGRVPLWNPYQGLGVPFLGSAYFGIFYPLNLAYFFLPVHLAMGYTTVLHIALAGLFTYIFLRKGLETSTLSALTGATLFMLSGPVALETAHLNDLNVLVWLPIVLFFTEKIFRSKKLIWPILFTVSFAIQILGMSFQTAVYSGYTVFAYSLFRFIYASSVEKRVVLYPAIYLFFGLFGAICLSAVQWLPTMELSGLSVRSVEGISLKDVEPFKAFLTPENIVLGIFKGGDGELYPRALPIILSLLCLPAVFYRGSRPYALFFLFWTILTLLLSLGTFTPLYKLYYYYVPTGDWFRVPTRFLRLTAFSFSVLVALGSDAVLKRLRYKSGLLSGLALLILIIAGLLHANIHKHYHHPQKNPGVFKKHSKEGEFLRKHQGLYRTYISNNVWGDYSLSHKYGTLERVYVLNDYDPLSLTSYRNFVGAVLRDPRISKDAVFYGSYNLKADERSLRLMNLLSVKFVIEKGLHNFDRHPSRGIKELYKGNGVRIYENKEALPRCYLVYNTEVIKDKDKILDRLGEPSFDPRKTVILDENAGLVIRKDIPFTEVDAIEYMPERIKIDVDIASNGVLVLTDLYYPGWKAYVDGKESRILRANYVMRGLPIESGRHRVEFVYEPASFKVGLWTTLLTSLTILACIAYSIRTGSFY